MFIGRERELAALEERYGSGKFELGIMYGRRRVGKTTLLSEFVRGKRAVFFTAMETSAEENLLSLSRSIMGDSGGPVFQNFPDACRRIFEMAREGPLVFIIDEFPYLAASYPGISSVLQKLIDEYKANSPLFMIINGSSMTMMEDYFFTYKRPLYGRKTFQLKIEPFGFFEMKSYFRKSSAGRLPYIYGVYGGIPQYFEYYDQRLSFRENLIKNYLRTGAPLLDEPGSLLKQEVRDPSNYNAILSAIAEGCTRYSDIAAKAKLESGNIAGFLKNLTALNLIARESPVPEGGRRPLYVLKDHMIRFWYRFIPAYLSQINSGKSALVCDAIEAELDPYMGKVFEAITGEYLWMLNGTERLPFAFTQAGRWWGGDPAKKREEEIDIIAHDGKTRAIFCECKWQKKKTGLDVLEGLVEKSHLPAFSQFTGKYFYIFSRGGFTEGCRKRAAGAEEIRLIDYGEMVSSS
ncbi:MAG: ATP-binding protein [Treponema sp.]|jgi:AAA+ ATPase superfamily predicted ATPase|nr:ATP-binding protein [Treponema sp.]